MKRAIILFIATLTLFSCGKRLLQDYTDCPEQPLLFPDYTDITVPCNIAPLNFQLEGAANLSVIIQGKKEYQFDSQSYRLQFPIKKWKKMLADEKGDTLSVSVYAHISQQKIHYKDFYWYISPDSIDRYLSYRLIEPAYEIWNMLQVCERNLENFDTRLLADNNITDHSCINCHTSNRAANPTTFMHMRGSKGGTIYSRDGQLRKINTKTDHTAGAVYGEISQDGRFGIFTTAEIIPILHSYRTECLEVFDKCSDLILIDFEQGTVTDNPGISGTEYQETFPCFSANNHTIYFCRAPYIPQPDSTRHMRYDLYSISFNPQTGQLGDSIHEVFRASSEGKSVSFPKCSPDGKYLLFSVSDYGTFPIWHPETDLWMLELSTGKIDKMEETNGRYSDSYHSWSSNSQWIAFASKRDDRVYGRPYFAHVSQDGSVSKAFLLPQENPEVYLNTFKSYNIPELYNTAETYDAHELQKAYFGKETENLRYKSIKK